MSAAINPDAKFHNLETVIARKIYPTPTKIDFRGSHSENSEVFNLRKEHSRGVNLVEFIQRKRDGKVTKLNPDWVEWLMGWPIGWTQLEPLNKLDWRLPDSEDPAETGEISRVESGSKNRVNRLKAIGNGQYPLAAAMAFKIMTE